MKKLRFGLSSKLSVLIVSFVLLAIVVLATMSIRALAGQIGEGAEATITEVRRQLFLAGLFLLVFSTAGVYYFSIRFIIKPVVAIRDTLGKVSNGDLRFQAQVYANDEIGDVAIAFNENVGRQAKSMRIVRENSEALAISVEQVAASSQEIAAGNQNQANEIQEILEVVNRNADMIRQIAESAKAAVKSGDDSMETAHEGGKSVLEAVSAMKEIQQTVAELGKSSQQIGEIIKVINEIAEQTNLLALNAAIEAARAGEHGRGFAVVADEVRKLAERSSEATKEIETLIQGIQEGTKAAIKAVNKGSEVAYKAGEALDGIKESARDSANKIESIFSSSQQQAETSEQMVKTMNSIANITAETAAGAEETAATAQELNGLADKMRRLVLKFIFDDNDYERVQRERRQKNEKKQ